MTPRQITLVQTSFEKVVPIAEVAAELFYTRLFEIEPSLKGLFHGDMADQGRKLMTAMSMVVNGLDKLERILPMVQELDRRHGFTVAALQTGTPLNVVSKWLGHAQLKTTAIYTEVVGAEERSFAEQMWKSLPSERPDSHI